MTIDHWTNQPINQFSLPYLSSSGKIIKRLYILLFSLVLFDYRFKISNPVVWSIIVSIYISLLYKSSLCFVLPNSFLLPWLQASHFCLVYTLHKRSLKKMLSGNNGNTAPQVFMNENQLQYHTNTQSNQLHLLGTSMFLLISN